MPRRLRVDHPGAWHHVMHRGARREPIFFNHGLHVDFLDLLGELDERFELEVHAFALMTNHYHLLVRSRHGNLSLAMRHLNASYTLKANRARGFDGALFRGRFRSQLLASESSLPFVLAYLHLNPLRAGLITRLRSRAWTSHRAYLGLDPPLAWLKRDFFLQMLGSAQGLHQFVLNVHRGRTPWPDHMRMESGWMGSSASESDLPDTPPRVEESRFLTVEQALERVCELTGCDQRTLQRARKGPAANPARRFAVWALRQSTRLTHRQIGIVLSMSTQQTANVLKRFESRREPLRSWRRDWLALSDK